MSFVNEGMQRIQLKLNVMKNKAKIIFLNYLNSLSQ